MRWLLLKDLRILRRSPLLVALLVIYPIVVALLIGLALSRGPDKPTVAFVNEVVEGQSTIELGGERIDLARYSERFFESVAPLRVDTRAEAVEAVRTGDALAALIVPADIVDRLATGLQQARVEVIYNGDALKQSFVESTIEAKLAQANAALSDRLRAVALEDLDLLVDGGRLNTPIRDFDLLGLTNAERILRAAIATANVSSGVRRPSRTVRRTSTGSETVVSPPRASPRPSLASAAKRATRSSAPRWSLSRGRSSITARRMRSALLRPSRSKSRIGVLSCPPSTSRSRSSSATARSRSDSAALACASLASMVDSTKDCLSASPL